MALVPVRVIDREGHDAVVLLENGLVVELVKVVRPDPVVSVCRQDVLAVSAVAEALDPHPLPGVEDLALGVALVELARLAAAGDLGTVRGPGHGCQLILAGVGDLPLYLTGVHIPYANLQHIDRSMRWVGRKVQMTTSQISDQPHH